MVFPGLGIGRTLKRFILFLNLLQSCHFAYINNGLDLIYFWDERKFERSL
jgi:hypothetical protein